MKITYTAQLPETTLSVLDQQGSPSRSAKITSAVVALCKAPAMTLSDAVLYRLAQPQVPPKMLKISATMEAATAASLGELSTQLQLSINDLIRLAIDASLRQRASQHEPFKSVPRVQAGKHHP